MWPKIWSILENFFNVLENKVNSVALDVIFGTWQLDLFELQRNSSPIFSLFVFCPDNTFIIESGILIFSTITFLQFISPFWSFNNCIIYLGAQILGGCMLTIVISSWWIDPLTINNVLHLFDSLFYTIWILPVSFGFHWYGIPIFIPLLSIYMYS